MLMAISVKRPGREDDPPAARKEKLPLPGGPTGRAAGGAFLAVLLGRYAACISASVALLVQALGFLYSCFDLAGYRQGSLNEAIGWGRA
jgi:hypothetical protein